MKLYNVRATMPIKAPPKGRVALLFGQFPPGSGPPSTACLMILHDTGRRLYPPGSRLAEKDQSPTLGDVRVFQKNCNSAIDNARHRFDSVRP